MCRTCRLRFHRPLDPSPDAAVEAELCSGCGLALEPVTDLSRLVGFRAEDGAGATHHAAAAADGAWGTLRAR